MTYVLAAPVVANRRFPNHNYILTVRAPEIAAKCRPGQFVMAAELENHCLPYPLLKRALAVYQRLKEGREVTLISLLLKTIGEGTRKLASLQSGDALSLIGPLGNGFQIPNPGKVNLMVVGGTGIASIYLLAEELKKANQDLHLIYGAKSRNDLVGLDDFQRLEIPTTVSTEDGSAGIHGMVTDALTDLLKDSSDEVSYRVFACGPNAMMEAVSDLVLNRKIPCQISVEAKMACGFGVCLGCTVQTRSGLRLACTEGPVFDAQDFIWESASQSEPALHP